MRNDSRTNETAKQIYNAVIQSHTWFSAAALRAVTDQMSPAEFCYIRSPPADGLPSDLLLSNDYLLKELTKLAENGVLRLFDTREIP